MCDSNALGPSNEGQEFIHELEALVTVEEPKAKEKEPPKEIPLELYCPEGPNTCFFQGNAYLATDCDPFDGIPDKINCSLNGVNAMMSTMQLQFPENPDESPLMITDIFSGDQELPKECHRVRRI